MLTLLHIPGVSRSMHCWFIKNKWRCCFWRTYCHRVLLRRAKLRRSWQQKFAFKLRRCCQLLPTDSHRYLHAGSSIMVAMLRAHLLSGFSRMANHYSANISDEILWT